MTAGSPENLFAYTPEQLTDLPPGAVALALGCGNPVVAASPKAGESVVDLGCGGGLDSLLAVKCVGNGGSVVGVDRLPPMLRRARFCANEAWAQRALFVCADLEALPFAAGFFDVAISNNAFNLLPDRLRALREAFRVLRAGGRLAVADTVTTVAAVLPSGRPEDAADAWAGFPTLGEYESAAPEAGFTDLSFTLGPVMPRSGKVKARPLMLTGSKP